MSSIMLAFGHTDWIQLFSNQLDIDSLWSSFGNHLMSTIHQFTPLRSKSLDMCITTILCDALFTIAGDFNINLFDAEAIVKNFLSEMYCHNLYPTIFKTTRLTNSSSILIDNFFTNISM